jgi:hypothetical protein
MCQTREQAYPLDLCPILIMTLIKILHNMLLGGQRPKSAIQALNKCSPINLYNSLDSAKNAWRFPFSILGDTRQNLFWRWYKPYFKNGRRLG